MEPGSEPAVSAFASFMLPLIGMRPELRPAPQTSSHKLGPPWTGTGLTHSLEEVLWLLEDLLTSGPLADTIC